MRMKLAGTSQEFSHDYSISKKSPLLKKLRKNRSLFIMCLPAIIFFIVFSYLPMPGLWLAFVRFNFAHGIFGSRFVGIDNFRFLIESGDFWRITRNTILYNFAFILVGSVVQITLAVLLNEIASKYYRKITQSMMFLPFFMSHVIIGLMVYNLISFDFGLLNSIRESLGLARISVYSMPNAWPFIIVLTHVWQGAGYGAIIYFAAITGMDHEIMEAASVDGANALKRIRYIILPMLKPTFVILFLFSMGGVLRGNFGLFFNLVGSANFTLFPTTDIIELYVFRALMTNFNFSLGAAVSFYQSIFGFALVLFANWVVRRIEPDYALF